MARRKITELNHDRTNANKGTDRGRAALEASLRQYGAGRSILLDKHGNIIAGNKTAEVAKTIGMDDVVIVQTDGTQIIAVQRTDLDIDSPQGRGLAYADNRVGELSLNWNAEQVLADIGAGIDLSGLWDKKEMDDLLSAIRPPATQDTEPQIDRAEELRQKWGVEPGQLWQLGEHRLICGDCTDAAVVARVMGGDTLDLIVTDPPYGVSYADKNKWLNAIAFGNRIQTPIEGDHGDLNAIAEDLWRPAFQSMHDAAREGAVIYCTAPQGGDQMMMMMMMQASFPVRHELIWLKNNHVLGRADYQYKHEPILYAWKGSGHKYYGGFQTSIIEIDKPQAAKLHPTMKPVELFMRLIDNSSLRGEIVGDWFSGSGTTLIACENLGRRCRAVEIAPGYVAAALERWAAHTGKTPTRID